VSFHLPSKVVEQPSGGAVRGQQTRAQRERNRLIDRDRHLPNAHCPRTKTCHPRTRNVHRQRIASYRETSRKSLAMRSCVPKTATDSKNCGSSATDWKSCGSSATDWKSCLTILNYPTTDCSTTDCRTTWKVRWIGASRNLAKTPGSWDGWKTARASAAYSLSQRMGKETVVAVSALRDAAYRKSVEVVPSRFA
jgi:hypothetical protein